MTSGFDTLSLALFTSLSPAGVVAFIIVCAARLAARERRAAVALDRMLALPFSVVLVGFIASATHLGTPANALHVFSGVGTSPLSNEVLAAVAFLFLGGSYWIAAFKERFFDALARPWLVLTCAAGIAFMVFTSLAYAVDTVPTWDCAYTPANLVLSALFAGPMLGLLSLMLAGADRRVLERVLLALSCGALVAGTAVLLLHETSLASVANNEFSALTLAPDYLLAIGVHTLIGLAAAVCAGLSLRRTAQRRPTLILCTAACVLALLAVFITRISFYDLYMTVGF